jgi:acyl CoA:acetate/3-ketoacid CoA transferase
MEHESMLGDTRQIAMAAKNSGGIVIAQVLAPV